VKISFDLNSSAKILQPSHRPKPRKIDVGQLAHQLISLLRQPAELQVWQEHDSAGNLSWSAYHPVTKCSVYGLSEAEMRIWIEQRKYC
jgi:hypothetical protein